MKRRSQAAEGDSYSHRDCLAVRCEINQQLKEQYELDAREAALIVHDNHQVLMSQKLIKQKENKRMAHSRFEHAYHDIQMEKAREKLCEKLRELKVEDVERKRELDGLVAGGQQRRDRESVQQKLNYFFEEHFTALKQPHIVVSKVRPTLSSKSTNDQSILMSPRKRIE